MKRGMDDAFRRGDTIQPPGVGHRLVDLKDANGNLVIAHKNTIENVVEIAPEAAGRTRRNAEMIAYGGKSAIDGAGLFNEHKVGGKQTSSPRSPDFALYCRGDCTHTSIAYSLREPSVGIVWAGKVEACGPLTDRQTCFMNADSLSPQAAIDKIGQALAAGVCSKRHAALQADVRASVSRLLGRAGLLARA